MSMAHGPSNIQGCMQRLPATPARLRGHAGGLPGIPWLLLAERAPRGADGHAGGGWARIGSAWQPLLLLQVAAGRRLLPGWRLLAQLLLAELLQLPGALQVLVEHGRRLLLGRLLLGGSAWGGALRGVPHPVWRPLLVREKSCRGEQPAGVGHARLLGAPQATHWPCKEQDPLVLHW